MVFVIVTKVTYFNICVQNILSIFELGLCVFYLPLIF